MPESPDGSESPCVTSTGSTAGSTPSTASPPDDETPASLALGVLGCSVLGLACFIAAAYAVHRIRCKIDDIFRGFH